MSKGVAVNPAVGAADPAAIIAETNKQLQLMKDISDAKDAQMALASAELNKLTEELKYMRNNMEPVVPSVGVPQKSIRSRIVQYVRSAAAKILHEGNLYDDEKMRKLCHERLWEEIYREFKYRVPVDYVTRFKNMEKKNEAPAAVLDLMTPEHLEQLYALLTVMFPMSRYDTNINGVAHV